jgi:hypothetical protein
MTGPSIRLAGSVVHDGALRTWSVADGRRGRRWRATEASPAGSRSWVVETDPDGAFVRLEAATGDALLTLHREPDGSLHGHRIGSDGMDHFAIPGPTPPVLAGLDPLALAAATGPRVDRPATERPLAVILIDGDLRVARVAATIRTTDTGELEVAGIAERPLRVDLDVTGLPATYVAAAWPMQREMPPGSPAIVDGCG